MRLLVVQVYAGSTPVGHPSTTKYFLVLYQVLDVQG